MPQQKTSDKFCLRFIRVNIFYWEDRWMQTTPLYAAHVIYLIENREPFYILHTVSIHYLYNIHTISAHCVVPEKSYGIISLILIWVYTLLQWYRFGFPVYTVFPILCRGSFFNAISENGVLTFCPATKSKQKSQGRPEPSGRSAGLAPPVRCHKKQL